MAEIRIEADDVVVHLSGLERLGAMRGDVRVPRSAILECRVSDDPWSELRGIRAPGTGLPGVISLCTLRGDGTRDFAALYRKRPAVVIELTDAEFNRLIVSVKDTAFARELADQLGRRPVAAASSNEPSAQP
jgi:hypothetical protein